MMNEFEQKVLEHILDIKVDIGGIKEHLKGVNGKIVKNIKDIEINRSLIKKNEIVISKWVGGLTAVTFIANFIAYYFFK